MASSSSPVASSFRSPRRVNPHHQLTWRTISDCCIRLQHSTVEWSTLKSQGMDVANDLVRVTVESLRRPLMKDGSSVSEPPLEQRELARKLSIIIKKMEAVVTKMGGIVRNLWASAELVAAERTTSCTLPAPMIARYAEGIFCAHCEELQLKQSIRDDLLSQTNRDTLTVYLSCWLHEPCITEQTRDKLRSLILYAVHL